MLMIIAIAWLYVVLMMALTETSLVAGLATFFIYGVFPLTIVLYLLGTPARRRRRRRALSGVDQPTERGHDMTSDSRQPPTSQKDQG